MAGGGGALCRCAGPRPPQSRPVGDRARPGRAHAQAGARRVEKAGRRRARRVLSLRGEVTPGTKNETPNDEGATMVRRSWMLPVLLVGAMVLLCATRAAAEEPLSPEERERLERQATD